MTNDHLTAILAERVMGWGVGPDRFLTSNRGWMPRWRFQPAERLQDAFHLLEQSAAEEYSMGTAENGRFWAKVRIAGTTGEACEQSKSRAITFAIARAHGIHLDSPRTSVIDGVLPKWRCDE
jgi:hypothetical protein